MKHLCFLLLLLTLSQWSTAKVAELVNPCLTAKTCGGCVMAGPDCTWCSVSDYGRSRCNYRWNHMKSDDDGVQGCNVSEIIDPAHELTPIRADAPRPDSKGNPIQLSPQHLKIKLRPMLDQADSIYLLKLKESMHIQWRKPDLNGKPFTIPIAFRLAEDYPVDLYYLMDLSKSMEDDKVHLVKVGDHLGNAMVNITKNFRLGFGSFVDKVVAPYISVLPHKLENPCHNNDTRYHGVCAPTYDYRNQLSLTENIAQFKTYVNDTAVSGNLDSPESGFDAMMQTMVCKEVIKWRTDSRKIILFSTDAIFHQAGDGKLAGIVTPNDGECHMSPDGVHYTHSLLQDYPSVAHIARTVKENSFTVIFAVTKAHYDTYVELTKYVEGSKAVVLTSNSDNIVDLVQDAYDSISSKVELQPRNLDKQITLKFKSKCKGSTLKDTNVCTDLKIKENVTFMAEMFVPKCPPGVKVWNTGFEIYPVGLSETLKVELDVLCDCECGDMEHNSSKCSGGEGTYRCGVCSCNEGRYGDVCQCNATESTIDDREAPCKRFNTSDKVCENKGECICGECMCNSRSKNRPEEKYSGNFCECDDYACYYVDDEICGGPRRGQCKCSQCICNEGYTGIGCGCPVSEESCRASNGEICNGKGACECGVCSCNLENNYRGPTCEDCPTCPGKCAEYKSCVQCVQFGTGDLVAKHGLEGCKVECSKITIEAADEVNNTQPEKGIRKCQYRDDDDCTFFFNYRYNENQREYIVHAQKTKQCPKEVNVLVIVSGVIGGIVALGFLLLLIWKLVTSIHDKREFAKFEQERQNAKWDSGENPIYQQATSTFKNPTFSKE